MVINYENIMRNLKRIRRDKKLSQQNVAQRLGVTKATISLIESGKLFPSFDIISNIPAALGCHTIEIHAFDPETVNAFESVIGRVQDSYEVVLPHEHILSAIAKHIGDIQSLGNRSMYIYFRIEFLNRILKFFSWLSQETIERIFAKERPVARDIAIFLDSLPDNILKEAIGNRKLSASKTDENTGKMLLNYIKDEKCLDLEESPPLEGNYIAPIIGTYLGFEILPKNRLERYLDLITDILRNRPDLLPLLYVTIKKLSEAPRIDNQDMNDLRHYKELPGDKMFFESRVGIYKTIEIDPLPEN